MTPEEIRERYQLRKVVAPTTWDPAEVGEELCGFYGGRTLRDGKFGQYEVVIVHIPMGASLTVSGTKLITLLDASLIKPGHPIRIVWKGLKDLGGGKSMKDFEVLVAQGEAVPADSLPEVSFTEPRRAPPASREPDPTPPAKVAAAPVSPPTAGSLRGKVLDYVRANPGSTGAKVEADATFNGQGPSARALLSGLFFDDLLRREKVVGVYAYWLKDAS